MFVWRVEAELEKFKADFETAKLTYQVESSELVRLRRNIKACILVAPQDGKVVYASQNGGPRQPARCH